MNDIPTLSRDFPFTLAEYHCALINPPAQRRLFENKVHNIQLAISRMQPCVLQPGETFSFWRFAQAPTAENGYREGAMFINHQVKTSLGGGLCQLSGLLYNLALLSGCAIIERYPHSIDAYGEERYIPLGRDATVVYGKKDLRFRNPHPFPVAFVLHVDTQRARGQVLGAQALMAHIDIGTTLVKTLASPVKRMNDSHLAAGHETVETGLTGKIVLAWRVTTHPGQPPLRQKLSRDRYAATVTRIRRGVDAALPWPKKLLAHLGLRD